MTYIKQYWQTDNITPPYGPISGDRLQHIEDGLEAVANTGFTFSGSRVYRAAALALTDSVAAYIDFDTERYDTDAYHSTVTNPSRITIPVTGYYMVGVHIGFAAPAADVVGRRRVDIMKNRIETLALDDMLQGPITGAAQARERSVGISTVEHFVAGDYAEVTALAHNSNNTAVSLLLSTATVKCWTDFWIVRLAAG